jgi:hypothetical protein
MDDVSEFLLGPQRFPNSSFNIILTIIAIGLAGALMIYLLRCYIQEVRLRKRIKRRVHRPYGGNIVLPEMMPGLKVLSQTRRLRRKSSGVLPPSHRDNSSVKVRRRLRGTHPWKHDRLRTDSPTPH